MMLAWGTLFIFRLKTLCMSALWASLRFFESLKSIITEMGGDAGATSAKRWERRIRG